jgi:hypothetical protein
LIRQLASATALEWNFDYNCFEDSHYDLIIRAISICERPWGRAPELPRSLLLAAYRRSRRDFKKLAFPMAEERWSVAGGRNSFNAFREKLQA